MKKMNKMLLKNLALTLAVLLTALSFSTMKVNATETPTAPPEIATPKNPANELVVLPIPEDADDKNDSQVITDYRNGESIPVISDYRNGESIPVISDYRNGESIPVAMNYCGNWVDQYGHRMDSSKADRYLNNHLGYCQVVKAVNIKLNDISSYYRTTCLSKLPNGETDGSYSFVKETITEFKHDGTYILMLMCPSDLETLQAYLQWSEKEDTPVPVYKSDKNGWMDQYKRPISNAKVQQCFQNCPEYKEAVTDFTKYTKKYNLEDAEALDEAQDIYCRWYMESARYDNHIANDMFNGTVDNYLDSEHPKNELWTMAELAEDFQHMADLYRSWSSTEYEDAAVEALKNSSRWCDSCYEMYLYDNGENYVYAGDIYCAGGNKIGYTKGIYRYCTEGHLCGTYDMHEYFHKGDFYNALCEKMSELNK